MKYLLTTYEQGRNNWAAVANMLLEQNDAGKIRLNPEVILELDTLANDQDIYSDEFLETVDTIFANKNRPWVFSLNDNKYKLTLDTDGFCAVVVE
jgi:hypothetical protein